MIQAFFDTNVWFEYCWARYKRKRPRSNSFVPIHRISSREVKVVLTDPLICEISSLFKERSLVRYAMDQGMSAFEVRRLKREVSLKEHDRKEVDRIIENHIYSLSVSKDQYLVEWLDQELLDQTFRITSTHDIEFIDCLHVLAAARSGCSIFVTKDEALKSGIQKAARRYRTLLGSLQIMKPSEFMNSHRNSILKK